MSLADYRSLVPRLVRAPADKITAPDIDRAIASAVLQYGRDKPRELVRDVTWAATGYLGPVDALMAVDSRILQAETPVGSVPPELVFLTLQVTPPDVLQLLCEDSLALGTVVRVSFTAGHVLDAGSDTIPLAHRDAVGAYAAHLLCRELSTLFSGERESSISADGSNTDSRARNYAARAKDYRAAYYTALGIADPAGSGAGGGGGAAASGDGAGAVTSWPARRRPWFSVNPSEV